MFFLVQAARALVSLAGGLDAPQLVDHDRVGDGHDHNGQEEEEENDGRVVDVLAGPSDLQTVVVLVLGQAHRPAHVVALALHIVGPYLLRVRTEQVARHTDQRAQRPYGHDTREALAGAEASGRLQRIHDDQEALARDGHQREHARRQACDLNKRVDLNDKIKLKIKPQT